MQTRHDLQSERGDLLFNTLKGAVAGAIGVWVMDRVDWLIFKNEDPAARHRTQSARPGGLDPAHVAVGKVAEAVGKEVSPAQPNWAGIGLHYMLGIGPAALYGAFRGRLPARADGQDYFYGAALGLGLFAVQDEGLNRVMGLSAGPREYPWQAHARGLAAHLVLGLVTNAVLNLFKAPRPSLQPTGFKTHRSMQDETNLAYQASSSARGDGARAETY